MDIGLVHRAVCLFTSHLSLVLIAPIHGGMARLSWSGCARSNVVYASGAWCGNRRVAAVSGTTSGWWRGGRERRRQRQQWRRVWRKIAVLRLQTASQRLVEARRPRRTNFKSRSAIIEDLIIILWTSSARPHDARDVRLPSLGGRVEDGGQVHGSHLFLAVSGDELRRAGKPVPADDSRDASRRRL